MKRNKMATQGRMDTWTARGVKYKMLSSRCIWPAQNRNFCIDTDMASPTLATAMAGVAKSNHALPEPCISDAQSLLRSLEADLASFKITQIHAA